MAPKKKEVEEDDIDDVEVSAKAEPEVDADKRAELLSLLKQRAPSIFEREPAAAYATGNLERLVDEIMAL